MKKILFIFIVFPLIVIAQKQLLLKTILLDERDSSLVAYVLLQVNNTYEGSLDYYLSENMSIDSIIRGDYIVEYDTPYYKIIELSDTLDSCKCYTILEKSEVEYFIKNSKIKFYYPYYGNAPFPLDDKLSVKYGVSFLNEGCSVNNNYPRDYLINVDKLLTMRNGENWKHRYREEYKTLRDL